MALLGPTSKRYCNINFSGHASIKHIPVQMFVDSILPFHRKLVPAVEIETFCLMRDPLAWIESWYRFRGRGELRDPAHPNHHNSTGDMSFQAFIEDYVTDGKRKPHANIGTQSGFVSLADGAIGVDHIFPMDRMDLVSQMLSEKIGQPIDIPVRNVSSPRDVALDARTETRLREFLARDFALYDFVSKHDGFHRSLHADVRF